MRHSHPLNMATLLLSQAAARPATAPSSCCRQRPQPLPWTRQWGQQRLAAAAGAAAGGAARSASAAPLGSSSFSAGAACRALSNSSSSSGSSKGEEEEGLLGVVIVDHGSRKAEANHMLNEFVDLYKSVLLRGGMPVLLLLLLLGCCSLTTSHPCCWRQLGGRGIHQASRPPAVP